MAIVVFFAPHAAHAVVNSTFTISGGNQQQVAQTTISLNNTATGQSIQTTETNNGNKKTVGFILPDGTYHLTVTSGGKVVNEETFTSSGTGTASGGYNTDVGGFEPIHGAQIAQTGGGKTPEERRAERANENIIQFGGGFGPLFYMENTKTSYYGTGVGSGASYSESNTSVMPDFQLWGNLHPAGWNGVYLGVAGDLAFPTEQQQSNSFTTSNSIGGMQTAQMRNIMLNFEARVGMRDPVLPGSVFLQAGFSIQSWNGSVMAPSVGDRFNIQQTLVLPTIGVGARLPLQRTFGAPILHNWTLDGEFNYVFGSSPGQMPGGNSISYGTFQVQPAESVLLKLEYEFECFDP
jgi:hypothetical protein